jgi:phage gp36-like protein
VRYTRWEDVVARYPGAAKMAAGNDANAFENAYALPAEATVDASLALRYTVPVANTPDLAPYAVRDVATDLAYWKLMWMSMKAEHEVILRESINDRLRALATGSMAIVTSAGITYPSLGAFGTHADYANVSGIDDVEDWNVTSQWQSDQEALRE